MYQQVNCIVSSLQAGMLYISKLIVLYHLYKLVCYVSASYCIVSSLQAGMLCIIILAW